MNLHRNLHVAPLAFFPMLSALALLAPVPALHSIELDPDSGISAAEAVELEKRGKEILDAVWGDDIDAAYAFASTYYKGEVSLEEFREAMRSIELEIDSRRLVDITEWRGADAIDGGRNVHLLYRTRVEGEENPFNENLFLIREGTTWLMTGHWIKPGI